MSSAAAAAAIAADISLNSFQLQALKQRYEPKTALMKLGPYMMNVSGVFSRVVTANAAAAQKENNIIASFEILGAVSGGLMVGFGPNSIVAIPGGSITGTVVGSVVARVMTIFDNINEILDSDEYKEWSVLRKEMMDNEATRLFFEKDDLLKHFKCPLSNAIPEIPVKAVNGVVYDYNALKGWRMNHPTHPYPGDKANARESGLSLREHYDQFRLFFDFPTISGILERLSNLNVILQGRKDALTIALDEHQHLSRLADSQALEKNNYSVLSAIEGRMGKSERDKFFALLQVQQNRAGNVPQPLFQDYEQIVAAVESFVGPDTPLRSQDNWNAPVLQLACKQMMKTRIAKRKREYDNRDALEKEGIAHAQAAQEAVLEGTRVEVVKKGITDAISEQTSRLGEADKKMRELPNSTYYEQQRRGLEDESAIIRKRIKIEDLRLDSVNERLVQITDQIMREAILATQKMEASNGIKPTSKLRKVVVITDGAFVFYIKKAVYVITFGLWQPKINVKYDDVEDRSINLDVAPEIP